MKTVLLCLALVSVTLGQTRGHSVTSRRITQPGWLGVGFGNTDHGMEVFHVDENSPASKAGVRVGDIILEIGAEKVQDTDQVIHTIAESAPGQKLNLLLLRNGAKQSVTATLEARPMLWLQPSLPSQPEGPFAVMPGDSPRVGIDIEELTPQLAQYFGVKEGILVRSVVASTPAEKGGLKAGDVITKVAGTPVTNPHEILSLIHMIHAPATFTVMRNHKQIAVTVDLN